MSSKKESSVKDNKKRLPNFSTDEKITLIEIIERKKHIIENKQTDGVTIKEKEKCWLDISREFNSRCIKANRNVMSLKSCWDNLKKKTRKHFAEIRKEVFATGIVYKHIYYKNNIYKHIVYKHIQLLINN